MDKKILFYIGSMARGGAERVVVNLSEYLKGLGYQVVIATKEEAQTEYPVPEGVRRIPADISGKEITGSRIVNFCRRVGKLRSIWKKEKPDLIVSFIKKNNLMAIASSRGLGIPVLVTIVSASFREYPGIFKFLANLLFPMADGVIAQTSEERDYFRKSVRKKTVILPNSMHPDFIGPVYAGKREDFVVAVGRVDENKNHSMLVEAFARIADKYPSVNVIIYGDGDGRQKVETAIREKGMEERIFLAGYQTDVKTKIEKARIFVLTSRVEGIPNAIMEAMALGLVPVSTDFGGGGAKQLIEDGKNGFIIPVDDTDALTEKLDLLLSDKKLEERLRNQAVKLQERLHPDVVNRQWREYFERFL